MILDPRLRPEIAKLLDDAAAAALPGIADLDVAGARRQMREASALWWGPVGNLGSVADRTIVVSDRGGDRKLPIRTYRPNDGVLPVVMFFHGGGWVVGDLDTHDGPCRALAELARCVVVSVGYRLAPEHRFPAAPWDCIAATSWVFTHADELGIDASRLSVVGDSAGANLAAVVAQQRPVDEPAIRSQTLIYPVTDLTIHHHSLTYPEGYLLGVAELVWYYDHYIDDADRHDPLVSPMLAASLAGLPPAHVITCEFDPLDPQGADYARRLAAAGVEVVHDRFDGMIHGFAGMNAVTAATGELWQSVADHLTQFWLDPVVHSGEV